MNALEELRKLIEEGDADLLAHHGRADGRGADGRRGRGPLRAGYKERHPERANRRNGYRERTWDTRAGTIELALPKLR